MHLWSGDSSRQWGTRRKELQAAWGTLAPEMKKLNTSNQEDYFRHDDVNWTGDSSARTEVLRWTYQILAILLVNSDHPALCSALFAGLFDADIRDVREITQGLQLLVKRWNKITTLYLTGFVGWHLRQLENRPEHLVSITICILYQYKLQLLYQPVLNLSISRDTTVCQCLRRPGWWAVRWMAPWPGKSLCKRLSPGTPCWWGT